MPIWSRYRYRVEDYWGLILVLRQSNKYTHGTLLALTQEQRSSPERRKPRGELSPQAEASPGPEATVPPTFRFTPDPESPDLLAHAEQGPREVKGARVIAVPEGWIILGKKAEYRGLPPLADLRTSPSIRLIPFIIRWRPEFSDQKLERGTAEARTLEQGRLSLQINRDFVRLKLRIIREMTSRKNFYESTPDGVTAAWKKEKELIKGVNAVTRELIALKRWAFVEPDTYSAYDSEVRRLVRVWLTSVRQLKARAAHLTVQKTVVPWRYNPEGLPSKLRLAQQAQQPPAPGAGRPRRTTSAPTRRGR